MLNAEIKSVANAVNPTGSRLKVTDTEIDPLARVSSGGGNNKCQLRFASLYIKGIAGISVRNAVLNLRCSWGDCHESDQQSNGQAHTRTPC